jgi:hypothetical protein
VDASSITLGAVLSQPGEDELDHTISFARRKLLTTEKHYMTTEREGLAMVYALQNSRHYLLGSHFNMYTNHSTLIYLLNKPLLGGIICIWLFLFQEYDFKFIVKPGKLNARTDHFSWILIGEDVGNLDDSLLDEHFFSVQMVDDHFVEIILYLSTRVAPSDMTTDKKKQLVVKEANYQLIEGNTYKLGIDGILR